MVCNCNWEYNRRVAHEAGKSFRQSRQITHHTWWAPDTSLNHYFQPDINCCLTMKEKNGRKENHILGNALLFVEIQETIAEWQMFNFTMYCFQLTVTSCQNKTLDREKSTFLNFNALMTHKTGPRNCVTASKRHWMLHKELSRISSMISVLYIVQDPIKNMPKDH